MKELYINGKINDGSIVKKVKDTELKISSVNFVCCPRFWRRGRANFSGVDARKAQSYEKNEKLKGKKKKEFPHSFEFLADIVRECIIYKASAFECVNKLQLQVMFAITMEKKINY